jgi:hypothetical protein
VPTTLLLDCFYVDVFAMQLAMMMFMVLLVTYTPWCDAGKQSEEGCYGEYVKACHAGV